MNYYRRYIGDYVSKTAALSLTEHGAYNVLLDVCYSTERALPADLDALCRICRAMSKIERAAVEKVSDQFFQVGKDGLRHNRRADEEIGKAQVTIAKQRESGVNSANKRWSTDGSTDGSTHESTDGSTGGSAIQPPTSNHQPPNSNRQPPASNLQKVKGVTGARRAPAPSNGGAKPEAKSKAAWQAFCEAYRARYGTDPTRNAVENSAMAAFCELVPLAEAPEIAAFYVGLSKSWYVSHQHSAKYLRQDAAGIRTQWLNGHSVTDTEARQADRTQATGNAFAPLIAEAQERERNANAGK